MAKSLSIPAPARRDSRSVEMMRTWIAEGKLRVALNVGFWEQPEREIEKPTSAHTGAFVKGRRGGGTE